MGIAVVPGNIDSFGRVLVQQGLQQFGHLLAAFVASHQDNCRAAVIIDRAQAIALVGLVWGVNHHLLSDRTPHAAQRRQPTDIELVGVVKHFILL